MADKPWEKYAGTDGPWNKYAAPGPKPGPPSPPSSESLDYAKELGQGALNLLGGIGASVFKPAATIQELVTGHVNPTLKELATPPDTTAGEVGNVAGEAAQFLVPGALEEKAGVALAEHVPSILSPIARAVPSALSAGTINKLQGGDFKTGAAAGAAGSILGRLGESIAPKIAESSLGISNRMRAFGKTPGKAILEETTGYSPSAVKESTYQAMDRIGSQLADAYRQAGQNGKAVSLQPALQIIQDNWQQARNMRNPEAIKAMEDLANRLTTSFSGTGNAVKMTPEELWNVKRGLGMDTNWNPNVDAKWLQGVRRKVYGAIDQELDRAVPETTELNQRYSSLKPVAKRADIESRNAGVVQSSLGRIARHTGAGAFGLGGGYLGYREGGIPGAVAGTVGGLVGPEVIVSPTTVMLGARGLAPALRALPKVTLPLARQVMQGNGR